MKGIARVDDHMTPAMVNEIQDVLKEQWQRSLASLYPGGAGDAGVLVPAPAVQARRVPSPSDD